MTPVDTETYWREWNSTFRRFMPGLRFWPGGWRAVLRPFAFPSDRREFAALRALVEHAGDKRLLFTDVSTIPMHRLAVEVEPRELRLDVFGTLTMQRQFDCFLFGSSGRWGVHCSNDDEFSCLAAEPVLVDAYCHELGGPDSVRHEFLLYEREWTASAERRREIFELVSE